MLDSHPSLRCHGELFLQDGRGVPPWGARGMRFFEDPDRRAVGDRRLVVSTYPDDLLSIGPRVQACGFKLMYGQAGAYPEIIPELARRRAVVVHLTRRNLLDVALSREVAWANDRYHATSTSHHTPVTLDATSLPARLDDLAREIESGRRRLEATGLDAVEVGGEELCQSRGPIRRFLSRLGVDDAQPLDSRLKKLIPSRRAAIANTDEVVAALRGTHHEWMLDTRASGVAGA